LNACKEDDENDTYITRCMPTQEIDSFSIPNFLVVLIAVQARVDHGLYQPRQRAQHKLQLVHAHDEPVSGKVGRHLQAGKTINSS
jgi:hypothetical protein